MNLPASIAFLAASLKSLTTRGTSSVVSRLGAVNSATSKPLLRTCGVNALSVEDNGACPFGWNSVMISNRIDRIRKYYPCSKSVLSFTWLQQQNRPKEFLVRPSSIPTIQEHTCVWNSSHMPKLTNKDTAFSMNGIYNGLPGFNLLFCPYTRGMCIAA